MPNPLRLENLETELMSKDEDLVYVEELHYGNGSVYRGQIRPDAAS